MTSIDFYFNAEDRLSVACRLAAKAVKSGKRVLVHAPQPETAQKFDRLLWTWQAVSFVPHCLAGDPLADETPVVIFLEKEEFENRDILINLGAECPPHFASHERLLEVISQDEAEREAGRARAAFYKDRGYPIRYHDLAKKDAAGAGA